jgi:pyruvate/2-oxoglutarate dehydrogenase complex dihydrolipoamide acyltransferase (E2) component
MTEKVQFEIKKFPSSRQSTFDTGYIGLRKHHIKALIEVDVTDARESIKNYRHQTKEQLSFTAWMLKCISQAIHENKSVHAIRKGRNELVIFEDVDISVVIEKETKGEKVPLPLVIRKVNEKSLKDIHGEIKSAKEHTVIDEKDYILGDNQYKWVMKLYVALPQFLRLMIWRRFILKNPFLMKKMSGTVVVTSVGMMGNVRGWFIPVSIHPICFALGSIVKKPGVVKEQIAIREYLHMTILIDHDVIDGAPAARFVSRLKDLIESGYGLSCDSFGDSM